MTELLEIWTELGIPADYAASRGLTFQPEAAALVSIGTDCQNRDCRLAPAAAQAWKAMREAAAGDGITLRPISGFRSVERQAQIFREKLARGLRLGEILRANAAPGYSEHHTGRALDLTDSVTLPLSESFEQSPAFAWLARHAVRFGFRLSYLRGASHGFGPEPWHWCWHE